MNTNAFYERQGSEYLANNPTWDAEDSPWKCQKIISLLEKNAIVPRSVIEVGCGAGEILRELSVRYPDCGNLSGYDIAPDAIALCDGKETPRLHYRCMDPFSECEAFDLLLAIDVVEHVDDYYGFIRKCKEKATYKLFKIPLELSVRHLAFNQHFQNRKRVGHLQYFTKDTFILTLQDCGYEIVDWQYASMSVEKHLGRFSRLRSFLFSTLNKDFFVRFTGGYGLFLLAK